MKADAFSESERRPFNPDRLHKYEFAKDKAGLNISQDTLLAQVAANLRRGLPQSQPYNTNRETALLVCGGPTLVETEKELVDAVWRGGKVVCVNGSYDWCISKNIRPSAMVMLDARQFNARFVKQDVPGCKYFLAGQCHPDAFEYCKDRETYIFHACSGGQAELDMIDKWYFKKCHAITLGTTVATRAISLMRMLGFISFDVFGWDSCWLDDKHHAYPQAENDGEKRARVWLRAKGPNHDFAEEFVVSAWHVKQFEDAMQLIRERGNTFRLNVRGRGLIASMLRIAAQAQSAVELKNR